jgi:putative oxidoreductase
MWKKLIYKLLNTDTKDYGMFILRIALGIFIFAHGWQKLFGLFWWNWYSATMDFFTSTMWLPAIIAFLVIVWEGLGWIALILGHKTRFMATAILLILVWAVLMVHLKNGWYDFELHFLAIAISIVLIIRGGWAYSLDTVWKKMFTEKK